MIGVDPGLTGAWATDDQVHDLPIIRVHSKGYVDSYALKYLWESLTPRLIVIEMAGVRRYQGAGSTAQTWLTYGGLVATAMAMNCPVEIVSAAKWKRALGLIGMPKEASRAKALQLYPALPDELRRKKDHNRAEAVLLSHWGKRGRPVL